VQVAAEPLQMSFGASQRLLRPHGLLSVGLQVAPADRYAVQVLVAVAQKLTLMSHLMPAALQGPVLGGFTQAPPTQFRP